MSIRHLFYGFFLEKITDQESRERTHVTSGGPVIILTFLESIPPLCYSCIQQENSKALQAPISFGHRC